MKRYKFFAYMLASFTVGYLTHYFFKYLEMFLLLRSLIEQGAI